MKKLAPSSDGLITMIAITLVNVINYGLNLALGRWLGPVGFSEANIVATLILVISFLGIAVQLTVANEVARGPEESKTSNLKWIENQAIKFGLVFSVIGFLSSVLIAKYLNLERSFPIILISISIPFYFILSARRGYFQGVQNFKAFAATYIIETIGRVTSTIALLLITVKYAPQFNTDVIAIGFLVSFLAGALYTHKKVKLQNVKDSKSFKVGTLITFVTIITLYELSQILINNFDVILTKHFFDDFSAGLYSSIALIGRIVFFGTWTIVTLLFPKVIEKEKKGEKHSHLFYAALAIVMAGGFLTTIFCALFDNLIIDVLFGEAYAEGASLLWKYAMATTLFASANVFAYYYMSLKIYAPVFISLAVGLGQIALIAIFHNSLNQVITMQIISMGSLFATMLSFHVSRPFMTAVRFKKDRNLAY
jgi:O-antigen/teichoic acid export membrane protein